MADGNFKIALTNQLGNYKKGNPKSVKNQKIEIKEKNGMNTLGKKAFSSAKTLGSGGSLNAAGLLKGAGTALGVVAAGIAIASKGVDLYVNFQTSKTGQTLHYSNIKAAKNTVMALGTNLIVGHIKNELFTKNVVRRQNATLEYDRQLYNYNNQGDKYKTR